MTIPPLYCVCLDKFGEVGRGREKEATPGPNCIQRGRLLWMHVCLHDAETRSRCCNFWPSLALTDLNVFKIEFFMVPSFLLNLVNSKACAGRVVKTNKLINAYLTVGFDGVVAGEKGVLGQRVPFRDGTVPLWDSVRVRIGSVQLVFF
jgi:hypothetical protein